MNIFKKALRELLDWVMREDRTKETYCDSPASAPIGYNSQSSGMKISPNHNIDDFNQGWNVNIFPAVGGKVVRLHRYDPTIDRHISNLYIITDKEDFGEELAQILTRDSLSR